jgi:chemotaxis protein MotB
LARKKKESSGGGEIAPWMATFADLMNLLLCFFVLLFSLSTVSEQKFEDVSISMANSFGVFEGGGSDINGEGRLISAGVSQLTELSQFINDMGKSSDGLSDSSNDANANDSKESSSGSQEIMDTDADAEGVQEGSKGADSPMENDSQSIKEALSLLQAQMKDETKNMYNKTSSLTEKYDLQNYVELSLDSNYQYVQLTIRGSVLFDSGSADIREEAYSIFTNLGKILEKFEGHSIEITGHTDNIPISNSNFRDNNWLSSARALNAAEYLIDKCGIDPDFLKYSGRGEYDPIASNSTAAGRAKNRRIEIKVYNRYYNN